MNLDMTQAPPNGEFQQLSPTGTSDYTPPQFVMEGMEPAPIGGPQCVHEENGEVRQLGDCDTIADLNGTEQTDHVTQSEADITQTDVTQQIAKMKLNAACNNEQRNEAGSVQNSRDDVQINQHYNDNENREQSNDYLGQQLNGDTVNGSHDEGDRITNDEEGDRITNGEGGDRITNGEEGDRITNGEENGEDFVEQNHGGEECNGVADEESRAEDQETVEDNVSETLIKDVEVKTEDDTMVETGNVPVNCKDEKENVECESETVKIEEKPEEETLEVKAEEVEKIESEKENVECETETVKIEENPEEETLEVKSDEVEKIETKSEEDGAEVRVSADTPETEAAPEVGPPENETNTDEVCETEATSLTDQTNDNQRGQDLEKPTADLTNIVDESNVENSEVNTEEDVTNRDMLGEKTECETTPDCLEGDVSQDSEQKDEIVTTNTEEGELKVELTEESNDTSVTSVTDVQETTVVEPEMEVNESEVNVQERTSVEQVSEMDVDGNAKSKTDFEEQNVLEETTDTGFESETDMDSVTKAEVDEAKPENETESFAEPEAAETKLETESKPELDETRVETESKPEVAETKVETESKPQALSEPEVAETKAEPEGEVKGEVTEQKIVENGVSHPVKEVTSEKPVVTNGHMTSPEQQRVVTMPNYKKKGKRAQQMPTGDFHRADDEAYEPTYNEAFPPLMEGEGRPMVHPSASWKQPSSSWAQKPVMTSSTVTQVFRVPLEERRLQDHRFGDQAEQAKICTDIQAKVGGVAVETSVAKDQSLTVVLTGKPEQVRKAKNLLTSQLQTQVVFPLSIPTAHHGAILGKNGKRLQELEASTATKIAVPRPYENSDVIKITGTKEGVDKAKHEIQMISDELAKKAIERLNIPNKYHPFICGQDNKVQQAIQQATGARINIPPPSMQKDEVVVNGEKEGVAEAVKAIMLIYQEKVKTCKEIPVQVKKSQHKYIIGPRGSGIQEILGEYDVSVEVPPLESSSETITLLGQHKNLGSALTAVYAKADSVVTTAVEAKSWLHRFIIGRNGANVKNITQDLPKVHIEFTEDEEKITLEGPPDEVNQAKAALETLIADLLSRMDMATIKVDPKFHRFVIGKAGANLKRIKAETGVSIHVPSESENSDLIRIEGDKEGVKIARDQLMDMVKKMENEKSMSVIIESRFHRSIIGTKGEQIREIRDKFNQVQITFPEEGKKSDIVQLRGPTQDVDQCAKYLQQLNKDMVEKNHQIHVYILKQYHKNIIGKNGATIRQIRDDTDTKIDLPSEHDSSNIITITGKKSNCEQAKKRLLQIGEEQASIKEVTIDIPHKLHNSIIGAKGRLIKSIMDDCPGVLISFPKENDQSNKVNIRGPSDEVENAKQQLLDLSKERQESSYVCEVKGKREFHRFLIGKNGINIKKIRDSTGARIVFPGSNDQDQETITVIGKKEGAEQAKKELQALIQNLENTLETELQVDQKYHSHFVARRCEVLRQLGDDFGGVLVSFPRQGVQSERVTVKGPRDCVLACKQRIQEIVDDLASQVTTECVIPQKHHRRVMGAKGHNVEEISSKFNVKIKFPDRPPASNGDANAVNGEAVNGEAVTEDETVSKYDVIIITGKSENCLAASQAFQDLVPITELVEVPHRFHRYIIGQKGRDVRKMMEDYEVNISIPPVDEKLDTITVSGAPANARRAIQALQEKLSQFMEEERDKELKSYSLTLEVKPEYHPKIIGRKGAVISKIRDQYDVNIQFPERGAENDSLISITGYEEKVHQARDDILKLVSDLDDMVTETLYIDPRVHARVIGQRGKAVRAIMEKYKVDIRFPTRDSSDPGNVTVMGAADNVEDCLDHLQNLAEEFEQDLAEEDAMQQYMKPPSQSQNKGAPGGVQKGFTVREAPWDTSSTDDFPSIGAGGPNGAPRPNVAWGPARR